MRIPFHQLQNEFKRVLLALAFPEEKAELCSRIFAENSRDGVYSHGLNRFPVFVQMVRDGLIQPEAEPEVVNSNGVIEFWDGHLAPGMYTATLAMERAIAIAKESGMGAVAVKYTNHWMRGGTYGWQAAEAGCIGICATNTIANMPPWGGKQPRLGNNPLVIAIPRAVGHIVLDMAMSQFSYGKMQGYELQGKQLPIPGGYDKNGALSSDPAQIRATERALPVGFWKGAALSMVLDVLVASLSGGFSTARVTAKNDESALSQFFLCIDAQQLDSSIAEEIIQYTKGSEPVSPETSIRYPGESTMAIRRQNEKEGIPVNETIWQQVLAL